MTVKILVAALLIMVCSCNSAPDKKAAPAPGVSEDSTVEVIDTVLTKETISFFNRSGYENYARGIDKDFDWSRFHMVDSWKDDTVQQKTYQPDKSFFALYGPFLKYSPDSSMFIDLDSYNISLSKTASGELEGREEGPDTEVSLVDLKAKHKKRLVFLGPGGSVEDGGWLDNDNLVLIGLQDDPDGNSKIPVVWKYHIPTHTFFLFQSPDSIASQQIDRWRKERLKGVKIL